MEEEDCGDGGRGGNVGRGESELIGCERSAGSGEHCTSSKKCSGFEKKEKCPPTVFIKHQTETLT